MHVDHPVGHVLPADSRAELLEVQFHSVQGRRVDVLRVDHMGDEGGRRDGAGDAVCGGGSPLDDGGDVFALRIGLAARAAAVLVGAMLLDDEMRRNEAKPSCDIHADFLELLAALMACALLIRQHVVDNDGLHAGKIEPALPAPLAGHSALCLLPRRSPLRASARQPIRPRWSPCR